MTKLILKSIVEIIQGIDFSFHLKGTHVILSEFEYLDEFWNPNELSVGMVFGGRVNGELQIQGCDSVLNRPMRLPTIRVGLVPFGS